MNDEKCEHKRTKMWEPHLAGARKCLDCGWVKEPNRAHLGEPMWFDADKEDRERDLAKLKKLKEKYEGEAVSSFDLDRAISRFTKKVSEADIDMLLEAKADVDNLSAKIHILTKEYFNKSEFDEPTRLFIIRRALSVVEMIVIANCVKAIVTAPKKGASL